MAEKQYNHYKNLPRESLGLMSNEIWQRDPKMLGIHLARYKFVAKMLSGKKLVAEFGCGDGFYSRVVKQEVKELHCFDFDKKFITDIFQRQNSEWLVYPYPADITKIEFPYKYDAAFSLDVLEHISKKEEDKFLTNIKDSLKGNGVFICGIPSLESQQYASKASKSGHINCKSGDDLKKTLEKYWANVFLFSMSDEVIHTGFYPMAHYLMAICTNAR